MDWQAVSGIAGGVTAVGTIAAAVVVYFYTRETQRLRVIAENQHEAAMAPMIVLRLEERIAPAERVPKEVPPDCLGVFNRCPGKEALAVLLINEGKGVALRGTVRVRSLLLRESNPAARKTGDIDLLPLPVGKHMLLFLPRESLVGAEGEDRDVSRYHFEVEALYESASRRRYRSRIETEGMRVIAAKDVYAQVGEGEL